MNRILNSSRSKSGVSLIIVMLFMMIATIAATATYKWITSEGRSSTSRMLEREAYQSAVAGIDNARAWMTWHGNDVGAVIKQYIEENKPVNLTKQLRGLQRAGQNYQVWLVGANTENTTYKLKILSEGEARNGAAKHSEVAILNVDGLYQVKVPSDKSSNLNFNEAFFGGAAKGISIDVNSAIINGNTDFGTKIAATDKLIVTGDMKTNSDTEVKDLYVEGSLNSCTNLNASGDVYVKNMLHVSGTAKFDGSVYAEGGVDVSGSGKWNTVCGASNNPNLQVEGNLTSNGNFIMPQVTSAGGPVIVNGNLVLNGNAKIQFPTYSESDQVGQFKYISRFSGNVYLGGGFNEDGWFIGYAKAPYFVLGSEGKKVYSKSRLYQITDDNGNLNYSHWTNHSIEQSGNTLTYLDVSPKRETLRDTIAKKVYCNSQYCAPTADFSDAYFWDNAYFYWPSWSGGAQGSGDPLQVGYCKCAVRGNDYLDCDVCGTSGSSGESYLVSAGYLKRKEIFMQIKGDYVTAAPDTTGWNANRMQDYADQISSSADGNCKTAHVKDPIQFNKNLLDDETKHSSSKQGACTQSNLGLDQYSGDFWGETTWLKRWGYIEKCYGLAKDSSELYDDQWLLIEMDAASGKLQGYGNETLKNNYIIIVTDSGYVSLPPTTETAKVILYLKKGATLQLVGSGDYYNYFIYSDGDIDYNNGNNAITGSIFLSDCHNITAVNPIEATYNATLTDALAGSAILCNTGETCSTSSKSSSSTSSSGDYDAYYISTAPQLGITLETQYKNREKFNSSTATDANGGYIVLPRVIYLPADPVGKLSDYYNVLGLNGAKVKKSDVNVSSCKSTSGSATLRVSGSLYYDGGDLLTSGIYECTANHSTYGTQPFWVVIGSKSDETPQVHFAEETVTINVNDSKDMVLVVPPHANSITLNFTITDLWAFGTRATITPNSQLNCDNNQLKCTLTLGGSTETQQLTLFTLETSGSAAGSFRASLNAGEGYNVGSPWMSQFIIGSDITLKRVEVQLSYMQNYCNSHKGECPDDLSDWRTSDGWYSGTCGQYDWVSVTGSSCAAQSDGLKTWKCATGGNSTIAFQSNISSNSSANNDCIVIIPDSSLDASKLEKDKSYSLPASILAKPKTMYVKFSGDVGQGKNPVINIQRGNSSVSACAYDDLSSSKTCSVTVFSGDLVTVFLEENSSENDNFSYWKCENSGGYCPSTDAVSSDTFPSFRIQGSATYTLTANFGESDKHCFFDEFNRSQLFCDGTNPETEYCLDASGTSNYPDAKWKLAAGNSSDLLYENGMVSLSKRSESSKNVRVMSTVVAGLYGTLKAAVQISSETSTYGPSSSTFRNTGLLLRTDEAGTSGLVLNAYANSDGKLSALLCTAEKVCKTVVLKDSDGNTASVSSGNIVMVEATLGRGSTSSTTSDILKVTGYIGSYYNSPKAYTGTFSLSDSDYALYANSAHEYVGFTLADENFKLLGIGWSSDSYGSMCHDTYPTVKCSFRAVAEDGTIPTGKDVLPWVGHSGWYSSKDCSVKYAYKNGSDACYGFSTGESTCPTSGYNFEASGAGLHGYVENGSDVKTAYASMSCSSSDGETALWGSTQKAHCGQFWTGAFTECTESSVLLNGKDVNMGDDNCVAFGEVKNLRSATLNVTATATSSLGTDAVSLDLYLASDNDSWGAEPFYSQPVHVTGYGSYDVVSEMAANSEGFDPEHVSKICYSSKTPVKLTVSAACENSVSISSCKATYSSGTNWNVSATLSDGSQTSSIEKFVVTRSVAGKSDQDQTYNCNTAGTSGCYYTSSGTLTSADLAFADDINPYTVTGETFGFKVAMTANGVTTEKDCDVSPSSFDGITSSCKVDGTVYQGSGLPTFSFSLSGCPAGSGTATACSYEVTLDGTKLTNGSYSSKFSSNFSGGTTSYNTVTSPLSAGTHTFKVSSPATSEYKFDDCEAAFDVKSVSSSSSEASSSSAQPTHSSSSEATDLSVTCGFSTHNWEIYLDKPYAGQEFYFMAKNNKSSSKTYALSLYSGSAEVTKGTLPSYSGLSTFSLGILSAGTYSYSLYHDGSEICSATVTVDPTLTCSVSASEIGLGESFTLNTHYTGSSCWESSLQGNGVSNASVCQSSYTITPTSTGTHSYTYQVTNGSRGAASCSETVTVSEKAPTVTCPDASTQSVNSTVTLSPKALTGCSNGCSYEVTTSSSGWWGTSTTTVTSGSGLTSGGSFSFTGESSETSKSYTLKVSNSVGSATCDFTVKYSRSSTSVVTLDYGQYVSFEAGKTYSVKSNSSGGQFVCTVNSSKSYNRSIGTFNGTSMSMPAWNTNTTASNPGYGNTVSFVVSSNAPSDLKCGIAW